MDNTIFLIIPAFIIVHIIINAIVQSRNTRRKMEKAKAVLNAKLEKNGVQITKEYEWNGPAAGLYYRFIVDNYSQCVLIIKGVFDVSITQIPFSEICGFEMMIDDDISSGVGRAVIGGILAGGIGAIVGASTGSKKKITSFSAVIFRESIQESNYIFSFIRTETSVASVEYQTAREFALNINSTIKAILAAKQKWINENPYPTEPLITAHSSNRSPLPEQTSMRQFPIVEREKVQDQLHYCPRCGKKLNPGAKFCYSCGSSVPTPNDLAEHEDEIDLFHEYKDGNA